MGKKITLQELQHIEIVAATILSGVYAVGNWNVKTEEMSIKNAIQQALRLIIKHRESYDKD